MMGSKGMMGRNWMIGHDVMMRNNGMMGSDEKIGQDGMMRMIFWNSMGHWKAKG